MDYIKTLSIIPRSLIALFFLFFITKMIGKKQVSELSLFDYVIGISIGNFAAETILNFEVQFENGIVAVLVFGICSYLVSILTMKSIKLRRFIIGVPTVIMQNGVIIKENLIRTKVDLNDILEQVRICGYFDLNEIAYIIMETNGKLSILPKNIYRPLTPNDMNLKIKDNGLCANVIIDGKIIKNNLINMKKDENWLIKELKIRGFNNIKNLLLVTLDNQEKLTIYENKKEKEISVLE